MTSLQAKQWLSQGIAAAKAGDAERARELLLQVVDADEYNEQAWLWLSSVVDSDTDREVCLENVLAINPDNNLAKAGLVHLRSLKMPPPAEPEPTPPLQPEWLPATPAPARELETTSATWWSQSQTPEPALESSDLLEERLATATAPPAGQAAADVGPEQKPKRKRGRRRARLLLRGLRSAALVGLGLLAVGTAVMFVLRVGPFDPNRRNYASAMRPVLADYEAWWDGPYGALLNELTSLCGPTADGWRNQDVLLNCGRYQAVDCALLAAHCGGDVDAMRERIDELSQEAQKAGQKLLAAFDDIAPPDDVAPAHAHFLACLQAQVADAARTGELARGGPLSGPDYVPACQMFPDAEIRVRQYVESW